MIPAAAQASPGAATTGITPGARPAETYSVTLVTGDKVHVTELGKGKYGVRVTKGKGRERIPFVTRNTPEGLIVTPADAVKALATGKLDRRLFNLTLLRKWNYDDAHTRELPLMTTAPNSAKVAPSALPGSRAVQALPKLGVTSVRERKSEAGTFWSALAKSPKSSSVGKVYLVGRLKPTLDVSVPQVGAPVAWAAGNTGKGATVAVVDTGVDANHPDLKGVVTDAKDFTGSELGVKDEVGHGTHVAGTIAGRGTASNGKYTGVAKGAEIKSAKVCQMFGCPEDAILAGMNWAAESGAKVINMSLGGPPAETADLIEQTVDYLTFEKNVLFVIAAGNDGAPESIGSPGNADTALTVGSVDKGTDALSFYSSQGPRIRPSRRLDYAIKPDITAPGRDIVAPRAEGTLEDAKVGEDYAQLSGTSMATPHVAGGAAILAAQHPDWTPFDIKAALMSTSQVIKGQTVYQQGAGRLDVGRASAQSLTATGSLSLGYFPWPNKDAPAVTKKATYTNRGTNPVTLKLDLKVADAAGKPAAAKMFGLSAKTVTVQPGESAQAGVTVTPNAGAIGLYSGVLTATSADGRIVAHTAIGAYKEPPSYNLSYTELSSAGSIGADLLLFDQKTKAGFFDTFVGAGIKRVPAGEYLMMAVVYDSDPDSADGFTMTFDVRKLKISGPSEIVLDARKGKPVKLAFDGPKEAQSIDDTVMVGDGFASYSAGGMPGTIQAVAGPAIPGLLWSLTSTLTKNGAREPSDPTPYTYNISVLSKDKLPANHTFVAKKADLAAVVNDIAHQAPEEARDLFQFALTPGSIFSFAQPIPTGQLYSRTDYMSTAPGVTYQTMLASGTVDPDSGYSSDDYAMAGPNTQYKKGAQSPVQWNKAVFSPSVSPVASFVARDGDDLVAYLGLLSTDRQGGAPGWSDTGSTTLSRDGKVVATSPIPGYIGTKVPSSKGSYRLETTSDRAAPYTKLSSHVDAAWTFSSGKSPIPGTTGLILQAVRFGVQVDRDNKATAGPVTIPVTVERTSGTATAKSLTADVSYDGGKTWTALSLTGTGIKRTAKVTNPAGGSVSLRYNVTDAAGFTSEATIINAYVVK